MLDTMLCLELVRGIPGIDSGEEALRVPIDRRDLDWREDNLLLRVCDCWTVISVASLSRS